MQENQAVKNNGMLSPAHAQLAVHEQHAFRLLEQARHAVDELAIRRAQMKMSNSRIVGISKELKELIKVFAIATC